MENSIENKQQLPCKSVPNLSLNPLASEFVPFYKKNSSKTTPNSNPHTSPHSPNLKPNLIPITKNNCINGQKMKSETTSTTTLAHREIVGDASYLHAQRQLFELLHQLGNKFMPLKAIHVSLSPDGQGINVQFKGEQEILTKHMLDESLCQDASLHLEMSERSFMPRRLPNVLAANFMARMGDVLNDKMEWNEQPEVTNCTSNTNTIDSDAKPENQAKRIQSSTSSPVGNEINRLHKLSSSISGISGISTPPKKQLELPTIDLSNRTESVSLLKQNKVTKIPNAMGGWNRVKSGASSRTEIRQRSGNAKQDSQHDKKSLKGRPTPRKSLGQSNKKGTQKLAPRGTYTSLMRQSEAQKRLRILKDDNN